jgi:modification methylase
VPFAALIERGMIAPGAGLFDAKRRHKALVRADGAIALVNPISNGSLLGAVGSIHRIGALAQGLDACNGWTFWHVERKGALTLIDALRAQVRAEIGAGSAV